MSTDNLPDQLARQIRMARANCSWVVRSDADYYGGALSKLDDDGRARLLAQIETEGCEGIFQQKTVAVDMSVLAIRRSDGD